MGEFNLLRLVPLAFLLSVSACSTETSVTPNQFISDIDTTGAIHLALGTPVDADASDDYVIVRRQYALSYNKDLNVPNWVSWNLNTDWYGEVDRYSGSFIRDTSLPDGFYRVKHSDYTNSGYDRGHMVRSEERTLTEEDNRSTFLLTNILPQRPDLNRGVWLDLEYWCEEMCKDSLKELYVIAGGIFHEPHDPLSDVVAVPDSCFKIIVVLERGQGLAEITADTRVVAVVMPNIDGIRSDDWEQYVTSVDRIEASTGYDFLDLIPDTIEQTLERD